MSDVGREVRRLREERDWSQAKLAVEAGMAVSAVSQIENGKRSPSASSLTKLARALGVGVRDLFPLGQAPLPDFEDERPTAEPLPAHLRRFAAWRRRALLDRVFGHLTVREETLRDQAKAYYEARDSEELFPLYLDAELLRAGAAALLTESREEAQEIGGETKEERRLRSRLEHRIEDLEDQRDNIGDMWEEVIVAEATAKRKELKGSELENVRNIFERKKAV